MKKKITLVVLTLVLLTTLACGNLDTASLMATVEAMMTPTVAGNSVQPTAANIRPTQENAYVVPTPYTLNESIESGTLSQFDQSLSSLYQAVNPGIVFIRTSSNQGEGLGSGFVFDKDGHILTNYHVVEGANTVEVDFPSGIKVMGEVIAYDGDTDLAVIKVDIKSEDLHPLPMGDSDALKVGQVVIAIGNPFGLSGTMTMGIVSAKGRVLTSIRSGPEGVNYSAGNIIQTDTLINPGNSGGPLLNLNGEVVGINRAIRTAGYSMDGSAVNTGIGYAIGINLVKKVLPDLIQSGSYRYPYLGLSQIDDLSLLQMRELGIDYPNGSYVVSVSPGGPAQRAGLRGDRGSTQSGSLEGGGDLIIGVDGRPVKTFSDVIDYMMIYKSVGDTITLTIVRNGQTMDIDIVLAERP